MTVTFAEVPIGHVFQLCIWNCGCFIRKKGEFTYSYMHACPSHSNAEVSELEDHVLGDPTAWWVDYDPFVAMLEKDVPDWNLDERSHGHRFSPSTIAANGS